MAIVTRTSGLIAAWNRVHQAIDASRASIDKANRAREVAEAKRAIEARRAAEARRSKAPTHDTDALRADTERAEKLRAGMEHVDMDRVDDLHKGRAARWALFHDRLHGVVDEAIYNPEAFDQLIAAVAALARFDSDMAKRIEEAVPKEAKKGTRPRRAWEEREIVGYYEDCLAHAKARGDRYPQAVARGEVADYFGMKDDAIRSIVRRSRSVT